jgi:hypothetical protein
MKSPLSVIHPWACRTFLVLVLALMLFSCRSGSSDSPAVVAEERKGSGR